MEEYVRLKKQLYSAGLHFLGLHQRSSLLRTGFLVRLFSTMLYCSFVRKVNDLLQLKSTHLPLAGSTIHLHLSQPVDARQRYGLFGKASAVVVAVTAAVSVKFMNDSRPRASSPVWNYFAGSAG